MVRSTLLSLSINVLRLMMSPPGIHSGLILGTPPLQVFCSGHVYRYLEYSALPDVSGMTEVVSLLNQTLLHML